MSIHVGYAVIVGKRQKVVHRFLTARQAEWFWIAHTFQHAKVKKIWRIVR